MESNLEDFESVKRWFANISSEKTLSRWTRLSYLWSLRRWVKFMGKSPDEIIAERRGEMKDPDVLVQNRHMELLRKAFSEMEAEGKSRSSCVAFWAAIKSFYHNNYAPLFGKSPPSWPTKVFKVPNREELRRMYEAADPRTRSWILSQKDSGISGEDLINLNLESKSPIYGTIGEQLKSGQVPLHVNLMRGKFKAGGFYDTFLGEESFNALQESEIRNGRIFNLSMRYLQILVPKAAKKACLKGGIVTLHCLRKYFNTRMKLSGVNDSLVEYLMGHSLGRVREAYLVPPAEELLKVYLSAYPNLRCLGPGNGSKQPLAGEF